MGLESEVRNSRRRGFYNRWKDRVSEYTEIMVIDVWEV